MLWHSLLGHRGHPDRHILTAHHHSAGHSRLLLQRCFDHRPDHLLGANLWGLVRLLRDPPDRQWRQERQSRVANGPIQLLRRFDRDPCQSDLAAVYAADMV